jgi:hypothetical protein
VASFLSRPEPGGEVVVALPLPEGLVPSSFVLVLSVARPTPPMAVCRVTPDLGLSRGRDCHTSHA